MQIPDVPFTCQGINTSRINLPVAEGASDGFMWVKPSFGFGQCCHASESPMKGQCVPVGVSTGCDARGKNVKK